MFLGCSAVLMPMGLVPANDCGTGGEQMAGTRYRPAMTRWMFRAVRQSFRDLA